MSDDEERPTALELLPVHWLEPWVCEDSFDNRRELRDAKHRWRVVPSDPDGDGSPSGLIEVVTPAMAAARMHEKYRDCLVDPTDAWSDYVDCRHLPLDAEGVPYWVHRRAEKHERWEASTGSVSVSGGKTVAKAHAGTEPYLPVRCKVIKKDGTRCWAWAIDAANDGVCRTHAPGVALRANMGHQIVLAKVRVMQAMPAMAENLEDLALNAASEQVRLKATTEMMDRGGVNASTDVNVQLGGGEEDLAPADLVRQRLADMAERAAKRLALEEAAHAAGADDIVDAEVVSDTETEEAAS